jgi:serine/threonine protein kinase
MTEEIAAPAFAVGPYTAEAILGVGGYGTVYRATAPSGDVVALKVVAGKFTSADVLARFRREGAIRSSERSTRA